MTWLTYIFIRRTATHKSQKKKQKLSLNTFVGLLDSNQKVMVVTVCIVLEMDVLLCVLSRTLYEMG